MSQFHHVIVYRNKETYIFFIFIIYFVLNSIFIKLLKNLALFHRGLLSQKKLQFSEYNGFYM